MEILNNDNMNIQQMFDDFFQKKSLEEQCTEDTLIHLHEAFLTWENEEMNISQLHEAFKNILHIELPQDEFEVLFKKMNFKRDGNVTWDEFISYLLVEFQKKDTSLQWQILKLPITGHLELLKSHHRTPIHKIIFCPEVLPDRTVSFERGSYLTITKDGIINYWSLDLEYQRSARSTNPYLKVQQTLITDVIIMPDVQIVCTSSTEYDLRFYDTIAKKFDLRILITSLETSVTCMAYYFHTNIKEDSYIILGDMYGTVRIISFSPVDRGPFKQDPKRDTLIIRYEAFAKGELPGMKVTEFKHIHGDWAKQVAYYNTLRAFMTCSRCSEVSLLFSDLSGTKIKYTFKVNMGVTCFTYCEVGQILVTGGPDCIVRVWNPFVTKRPNCVFQGHHATICTLVTQNSGKRVYSLAKDKCIKVWDVLAQTCIQTYTGLSNDLGEHTSMTLVYNTLNHKMIIAGAMIAVIVCDPVIDKEASDGLTHIKPVTCVLYNHLYKVVVTTGLDSCIIIWDPWLGRRLYLVTHAHSKYLYGQYHDIEITAACFDESEQLLVTGARDGTLKIWNFNTGTCLRNMAVDYQCEVTSLVWLENRILCSGWNRQVIEFATSDTDVYRKSWGVLHTEQILCSTMWYPQVLATATYNGEIILWRLETGQPFRKYKVNDPMSRFSLRYEKKEKSDALNGSKANTVSEFQHTKSQYSTASKHQESALKIIRIAAVRAMIFLCARPVGPKVGSLFVSLDSGVVQVWTHHPAGGFLEGFSIIHSVGDCALSLATDPKNQFLVTGHTAGYIKVWYLENYLVRDPPKPCMPLLRLEFPFLWDDKIMGRAKRAVRNQPLPILLSSVKGHTQPVTSLQVIPNARIIVSGSRDNTVRLWTLGGRYISTFGTFRKWSPILPTIPAFQYFEDYRFPPDIRKRASFTTLKVLKGGIKDRRSEDVLKDVLKKIAKIKSPAIDGRRLTISVMDQSLLLATITSPPLDSSLAYIPVYTHLKLTPLEIVESPKLPSLLEGHREIMKKQKS